MHFCRILPILLSVVQLDSSVTKQLFPELQFSGFHVLCLFKNQTYTSHLLGASFYNTFLNSTDIQSLINTIGCYCSDIPAFCFSIQRCNSLRSGGLSSSNTSNCLIMCSNTITKHFNISFPCLPPPPDSAQGGYFLSLAERDISLHLSAPNKQQEVTPHMWVVTLWHEAVPGAEDLAK